MTRKDEVQLAYDTLLQDLADNVFYTAYIKYKTQNKLNQLFYLVGGWLKSDIQTWYGNDIDKVADSCLNTIEIIRGYVSWLENVVSAGGGGAGTGDITGSGTAGRIVVWNGAKTITSDAELLYDATNDILTVENINHTGNYKENVIVVNSDTTLDNTHSHIVCVNNQNVIVDGLSDGNANGEYVVQNNGIFTAGVTAFIKSNGYYIYPMPGNPGYQWRIYTSEGSFLTSEPDGLFSHPTDVITWSDGGQVPLPNVHVTYVTFEITLPPITSSNVKIRYDLKNISSNVVNITTDGTQTFDGDVITSLTLGVGNQITLVATELLNGVYTWITFN